MSFQNSIATPQGILNVGNEIMCKKSHLEYDGFVIPMGRYSIGAIKRSGANHFVGLRSPQPIDSWGNLDGETDSRRGLWVDLGYFITNFDLNMNKRVIIKGKFVFRRKNLEGMECRTVGMLPDGNSSFVEFGEYVDGCSADGLGKAGHCAIIPHEHLKAVKESVKGKDVDARQPEFF